MKNSSIIKRIITAAILAPLILIALFTVPLKWYSLITAMILLLAAWEWVGLLNIKCNYFKVSFLFFCLIVFYGLYANVFAIFSVVNPVIFIVLAISLLSWLLATLIVLRFATNKPLTLKKVGKAIFGALIIIACWFGLNLIRYIDDGKFLVLILLLMVWGADTGAYFFGKYCGKRKLAPRVSPGKTWFGVIGALSVGLLIVIIGGCSLSIPVAKWLIWLFWALLTILISIIGDLFISVMKREAQVKDSGNLLPGHGGILDRIDSLLAAAPIFAFGLLIIGIY